MCLRALWLWNPRSPESQTPNLQIPHESSRWCKLEFKVWGGGNTPLLSRSAASVCLSLNRRALSKSCTHAENLHFPEAEFDFAFVTRGEKKNNKKWVEIPGYVLGGGVCVCLSFWMTRLMKSQCWKGTAAGPSEWWMSQKNRLGSDSKLL